MKMLDKLLRRAPGDLLEAEGGFSRGDRKAIIREFAEADKIEPGLGEKIARYVITGDGESVMLRIDAVLARGGEVAEKLKVCLSVPQYAPHGLDMNYEDIDKRLASRRRILIDLEGFDAAGMRRIGLVAAKAAYWLYGYGTDRCPKWLRALSQSSDFARKHRTSYDVAPFLTAVHIREMLSIEGLSIAPLVDLMFGSPRYGQQGQEDSLTGLVSVLEADPDAVCDAMAHLPARNRGIFVNYLADNGLLDRVPAYFERIFRAASANAKATREPALGALMKGDRDRIEARALKALESASVEERIAGVHVLGEMPDGAGLERLETHLAAEKSKKIVQAIEALRPKLVLARDGAAATIADDADGYTAIDGEVVTATPRRDTPDEIPADTADVLRVLMKQAAIDSRKEFENPDAYARMHYRGPYEIPFDTRTIPAIVATMRGGGVTFMKRVYRCEISGSLSQFRRTREAYVRGLGTLFARPSFGLRALARLYAADAYTLWNYELLRVFKGEPSDAPVTNELARRMRAGADVREIVDVFGECGLPASKHVVEVLGSLWWKFAQTEETPANATVWPVFAAQFDLIDASLAQTSALKRSDGHAIVLGLCALFPKPPRRYLAALIDAAAHGTRLHRRAARKHLGGLDDLLSVIVPLLKDATAARRIGAAKWLGDRKDAAAVPYLRKALGVEKNLHAKAAILAALAACGDDISDQFAEATLVAEAKRELPKLKVDYSAFLMRDQLPVLHWPDGRIVDPIVVEYWFARAHKLKQPAGDPLLHMALARLDPADAATMGRSILSTFVQFDTRKPTSDEANAYAEKGADARFAALAQWRTDYTRERAFAELRQERASTYLNSALDHRGLLALARFAPSSEAVAIVERYLKDHGKRPNQCRALLDMLAGDPIPQKLQLILATARRHKQPGARKYAGTLVDAVAEDRGWTASELADRTVPTLDLDATGIRPLPIGDKPFRLRLADDMSLLIENPDGKAIATLPSPTAPQDAADAKAAKTIVSAAKKELKQTVALQTVRLYEAMCVARLWDAEDFATYFIAHPILGRLLRRLVLAGYDESGGLQTTLRLLDDGTASDADDAPVDMTRLPQIGIAHRATIGEPASAAWLAHLDDYDVTPLFGQFDRPLLSLTDDQACEIADREGHAIDSFALRNAAAKRGYQPGGLMDGSYSAYEKIFADLGLAASIAFSGGILGERETHVAALHALRFVRVRGGKPSEHGAEPVELARVPPILRQEAWADYHAIAAAGTGFDSNWEKLGQW